MKNKLAVIILVIITALLLCSCTLVRFESPEEQRKREQEALSNAAVEKPRAADYLAEGLVYTQKLENQAGKLLAQYVARMPSFEADGAHSVIFERINEYYQKELDACADDCDALFQTVKRIYGEEWDVLEVIDNPYSVEFDYNLLDSPQNYICIMKTYLYSEPGGLGYTRYYPDVFLAENGWKLGFDDLFGRHAADARAIVMEQIAAWCEASGIRYEKMAELTSEDFTGYYAIDSQSLIFFVEPFMLSTNDGNGYSIRLDLALFDGLFVG